MTPKKGDEIIDFKKSNDLSFCDDEVNHDDEKYTQIDH